MADVSPLDFVGPKYPPTTDSPPAEAGPGAALPTPPDSGQGTIQPNIPNGKDGLAGPWVVKSRNGDDTFTETRYTFTMGSNGQGTVKGEKVCRKAGAEDWSLADSDTFDLSSDGKVATLRAGLQMSRRGEDGRECGFGFTMGMQFFRTDDAKNPISVGMFGEPMKVTALQREPATDNKP